MTIDWINQMVDD